MGALWVLLGFLVLLLGVDNAAGTVRRSTDRVVRVGGAATSKKSMVHSVPVSQHTGKSLGLKNKPKMSIQPSGKPVNPLGVLHRDRISKKQQPRPVLEKTVSFQLLFVPVQRDLRRCLCAGCEQVGEAMPGCV